MHRAQSENTVPLPPPQDDRVPTANAAVATAFPLATEAAVEILRRGGNAIDAAVAAAWALSVCEPGGSGLGGETSLLIHFSDGKRTIIDGHSYAPAGASLDCISEAQQRTGYRACTIPSTPAVLDFTQQRYGLLPAAHVMAPAIRIAEEGYPMTRLQCQRMQWEQDPLLSSPIFSQLFLSNGKPLQIGDLLRQRELAATLRRLASEGVEDFYHGRIARLIAEDMQENGGLITEKDLADGAQPVERPPLAIDYRGYRVLSMPPLGGGLQLLLALKIIERLVPSGFGPDVTDWYEVIAHATYAVFRQRERWPVGPDDLSPSLRRWLLSDERAQEIAGAIYSHWTPKVVERGARELLQPESGDGTNPAGGMDEEQADETTHLCVVDRHGNWVALTQSLQSLFGAKVAHPQLGFFYNNYLCTCPRYPHPYQLGSRCRPQSNAAPTIVLGSGGRPFLALGAAGSRRIISSVLQVISGVIDRGLSVAEAVHAPRLHALLSRKIWIEEPIASAELRQRLEPHFPTIQIKEPHWYKMGAVQAIQSDEAGGLSGAADPRRDGAAAAWREGPEESFQNPPPR